ncbi:MAG: hypothetical protein RLZZ416_819 [Candidatus Parcubacteria bacterium]
MLRILNQIDHQKDWPVERHTEFVKKCEKYIGELQKGGHLIAAQPLTKSGIILSGIPDKWKEEPLGKNGEVQVGYYHIRAKDLREAIELAKGNPEFEYGTTARIEVRPITEEEEDTGFVYPSK